MFEMALEVASAAGEALANKWNLTQETARALLEGSTKEALDITIKPPSVIAEKVAEGMSLEDARAEYFYYLSQQINALEVNINELLGTIHMAVENGFLENNAQLQELVWELSHPREVSIVSVVVNGETIPFTENMSLMKDPGTGRTMLFVNDEPRGVVGRINEEVVDLGGLKERLNALQWVIDHPEDAAQWLSDEELLACGIDPEELAFADPARIRSCLIEHRPQLIQAYYDQITRLQESISTKYFGRPVSV